MRSLPNLPIITEHMLRHYVVPSMPASMVHGVKVLAVSFAIIKEFLGSEWTIENFGGKPEDVQSSPVRNSFFQLDISETSTKISRELGGFRTFHFAELLLNLQTYEGFEDKIGELATGDAEKMEATFAELQVARMLCEHDLEFCFITSRQGVSRGESYDFDVFKYEGLPIHVEAKCKLENAPFKPESILSSLDKARKQVPKAQPAVIFVKVPQTWVEAGQLIRSDLVDLTSNFLRQTSRVVSIVFYTHFVTISAGRLGERHICHEITNEKSAFLESAPCLLIDLKYTPKRRRWIRLMSIIDGD